MNKILHAVILTAFGGACWFVALMLRMPLMVQGMTARLPSVPPGRAVLPAFTRLCMAVGPFLLTGLAVMALSYCLVVWVRKTERPAPWIGFLATTMSALILVVLPTILAIYLPVVDFLNLSTAAALK